MVAYKKGLPVESKLYQSLVKNRPETLEDLLLLVRAERYAKLEDDVQSNLGKSSQKIQNVSKSSQKGGGVVMEKGTIRRGTGAKTTIGSPGPQGIILRLTLRPTRSCNGSGIGNP